jgi:glycosyltransferase involved in cell wall biosynthesis
MPQPKLRVLLDLSMAARGFCGIAQDVRLLYKTLASCADVEVTGLIYPPRTFGARHSFAPAKAPRADRLVNQSSFLWALAEGRIVWPNVGPLRVLRKAQSLAIAACAGRAHLDELDTELLWNVVWRLLFAQSLSPDDIPLVQGGRFLLSNLADGMVYARALIHRRPFKLDTRGFDFLIVQGPRPFALSEGTRQIVRYHDMIPVLQPDTMGNPLVIRWHHTAIRQCASNSYFVCNSEPTRDDLTAAYPELTAQSATIPYMLADVFRSGGGTVPVRSIMETRRSPATPAGPALPPGQDFRYVMAVSTLEPRKNFVGLVQAFNELKFRPSIRREAADLKLVIIGAAGWKYDATLAAMREPAMRGDVIHLEQVTSDELRALYSGAEAFVFPSFAEGFGFPPMEAMLCNAPTIVSDIPAHRWVMGDASLYCNPYDTHSIAAAMERLTIGEAAPALRADLIARGRERAARYTLEHCSRQWVELLHRLKDESQGPRGLARSGSRNDRAVERAA